MASPLTRARARKKAAHVFFAKAGDRLSQGSVGLGNRYLLGALQSCGYRTRVNGIPPSTPVEQLLPLRLVRERSRLIASSPADLAFYDDGGLSICPPGRRWARRNVVFHHGLLFGPGTWIGNDAIDLHCGNSPYLARVLRSLLSFPDWTRRRCLDARAFRIVRDVTLPLPCVEEPKGSDRMEGADVPSTVRALLESGDVVGHALQRGKQDFAATVSILFHLNQVAREGARPPVRLLVSETDLSPSCAAALKAVLGPVGIRVEDLYVPIPALSQRALFQVMRACAFGLAYNTIPESFGFYVLESVYNGCPVFTNGAGNIRHVLPPGHGIEVLEDIDMARGKPEAYGAVARSIHAALADREGLAEKCRRGAAAIEARYNRGALHRDLAAALARLDEPVDPDPEFDSLRIELGPLVRHHDAASGTVVSDLRTFTLSPSQTTLLPELLGRTCGELSPGDRSAVRIAGLFDRGVLTLSP